MTRDPRLAALAALIIGFACATPSDDGMADAEEAPTDDGATAQADLSCFLRGATVGAAEARTSPLRQVRFSYPGGEGLLCYSAPSVRGRGIIGGLVPYGEPWRAGANEPTTFHLTAATSIGGVRLEPGSYSMYAIPGRDVWRFFLNSNYERWGIPISADVRATEVGSFTVEPESTDGMVEMLTYSHEDGAIVMAWENTRIEIPVGGNGT